MLVQSHTGSKCQGCARKSLENLVPAARLSGDNHSFICGKDELDKLPAGERVPPGLASDSPETPCMCQDQEEIKAGMFRDGFYLVLCHDKV